MSHPELLTLGAHYLGDGRCRFRVWAPLARRVEVHVVTPQERIVPLEAKARGYHEAIIAGITPGARYFYRLDGQQERPDPASRSQPEGVHGPSEVVAPDFAWEDGAWSGLPLRDYVLYELHVGTFTPEGTFEAIIPHLGYLKELGVTAIALLPVAQFPGGRNWGYDGVYPFAIQSTYGGPDGLKRLVNAAHQHGLAVVMDVVYNHLGPEGNYLADFGHYFTDRYRTPWGLAVNFDGPHSDEVRRYFIENALMWVSDYHLDALRLDALHAIFDFSAFPFLEELAVAVQEQADRLRRRVHLIGESDLNDTRLIRPRELGGFGLDAQWNDDFHHAIHTLLTGEQQGYYEDFGTVGQLARSFREGYIYAGHYSPFRKRRHGNDSRPRPAQQFVVFSQNHDQVGNRMLGERLSQLVPFAGLKLAAGAVILSPFLPLLFMGEEYGETAPFPYFISHLDPGLVEAVRQGRKEEFTSFSWQGEPPDPQDESTFRAAKLDHSLRRQEGPHQVLFEFYKELLRLRREVPALARLSKDHLEATPYELEGALVVRRWDGDSEVLMAWNFGVGPVSLGVRGITEGHWRKMLDSEDRRWLGDGITAPELLEGSGEMALPLSPRSLVLYGRVNEA